MKPAWLLLVALSACKTDAPPPTPYAWDLPPALPEPAVPDDNPMTAEKVELGRHLFYDKRMSFNGTRSCGTCHSQAESFSGGVPFSLGATDEPSARNEPSLLNVAYNAVYTWADPVPVTLEEQMLLPMYSEHPVELGLTGHDDAQFALLRADKRLGELFSAAYPDEEDPVDLTNIVNAIASFERTILSGRSPYDKYFVEGDVSAIPPEAVQGITRFFSEDQECYHCHGTYNFTDSVTQKGAAFVETPYHNTGLYNVDGAGAYPASDQGLAMFTHDPADMGKFKAPTLRNIALTGPYMHDGSVADLDGVLDHYASGGRRIADGPNAGDGSANPHKDPLLKGFALDDTLRAQLKALMLALTDETVLHDPNLSPAFDCPDDALPVCPATPPSFMADVAPILRDSCLTCHDVGRGAATELMTTWEQAHALHDKLVEQIHACTMPADSRLPDDQRATLLEWLACGDPNN